MSRRKVYVVNDGGHDYSDAERFGDIELCTFGAIDRIDIAMMYRELSPILENAHADDYIIMTSLNSLCCVATAIMVQQFGRVNYLLYKDGKYVERTLMLE